MPRKLRIEYNGYLGTACDLRAEQSEKLVAAADWQLDAVGTFGTGHIGPDRIDQRRAALKFPSRNAVPSQYDSIACAHHRLDGGTGVRGWVRDQDR